MNRSNYTMLKRLYTLPLFLRYIIKLAMLLLLFPIVVSFLPYTIVLLIVVGCGRRNMAMRLTTVYSAVIWSIFRVILYCSVDVKIRVSGESFLGDSGEKLVDRISVGGKNENKSNMENNKLDIEVNGAEKIWSGNRLKNDGGRETKEHNASFEKEVIIDKKEFLSDYLPYLKNQSVLVISNHFSAIDFTCYNEIASYFSMMKDCKYILKKSLFFIPIIGYSLWFLRFCFVSRKFSSDKISIQNYLKKMKKNKFWLLLFSEGTRFTVEKKKINDKFCRENNIREYENVLSPRRKGFLTLTETECFKEVFNYCIDMTVFYNKKNGKIPPLWEFLLFTTDGEIFIDARILKIDSVLKVRESFLEKCFRRKDKIIGKWKNDGWIE